MFRIGVPDTVNEPVPSQAFDFQTACVWECLLQRCRGMSYMAARYEMLNHEPEAIEDYAEEFGLLYCEACKAYETRDADVEMSRAGCDS